MNLYWAMELFYWIENASLRNWYALYTSGKASLSIGMFLKQLNGLFGLLENNAINTQANGRNFMQAFNQEVRLFQMTSIVPQLVDINGNSSEIDSLMKECLYSYAQQYKNVNSDDHKAAVEAAMKLYKEKELRTNFFSPSYCPHKSEHCNRHIELHDGSIQRSSRRQCLVQTTRRGLQVFRGLLACPMHSVVVTASYTLYV